MHTREDSEVKWSESRSVVSDSLWPHGLYSPWNSPGQNTGVSSLSLHQGIFQTQGSNPGLLHCRQELLLNKYKVSVLQDKKISGCGWWWWLHIYMNILNITVHSKMVKMVNFILYIFYYNKKNEGKKMSKRSEQIFLQRRYPNGQ